MTTSACPGASIPSNVGTETEAGAGAGTGTEGDVVLVVLVVLVVERVEVVASSSRCLLRSTSSLFSASSATT